MRFELLFDLAKLAFFVVGAYLVLQASVRRWRAGWAPALARRRVAVLGLLTLAMSAIKVIEVVARRHAGDGGKRCRRLGAPTHRCRSAIG